MDIFEDDIEIIILYHHIPSSSTSFGHSACAYSNPAFGQMFKMNAKVAGNGYVDRIDVTIYDSLEFMCSDICLDMKLHEQSGHFKKNCFLNLYEKDFVPANAIHHKYA